MGSYKNTLEKIMRKPTVKDITPEELQKFLAHAGFELKRKRGSHYIYGYPGYPNIIVIPMHSPIKPVYIDCIRDIIENRECKESKED